MKELKSWRWRRIFEPRALKRLLRFDNCVLIVLSIALLILLSGLETMTALPSATLVIFRCVIYLLLLGVISKVFIADDFIDLGDKKAYIYNLSEKKDGFAYRLDIVTKEPKTYQTVYISKYDTKCGTKQNPALVFEISNDWWCLLLPHHKFSSWVTA